MFSASDYSEYTWPLFLFHTASRLGQLYNPVTGEIILQFPKQIGKDRSYPLYPDSPLSSCFASYAYSLVNNHILFDRPSSQNCACISDGTDARKPEEFEDDCSEFSTAMLRPTIETSGLPSYYDTIGFSFLDGMLYSSLYCEVIELHR